MGKVYKVWQVYLSGLSTCLGFAVYLSTDEMRYYMIAQLVHRKPDFAWFHSLRCALLWLEGLLDTYIAYQSRHIKNNFFTQIKPFPLNLLNSILIVIKL